MMSSIYLEGPDRIRHIGPLRVEYHRYHGPSFWIGERLLRPGRWSLLWVVWWVVKKDMEGKR